MLPAGENKQNNENITKSPKFSGVVPLSRRMANAFDRMQEKVDLDKGLQKKDTIALGKLLLEIELVNNNLQNIASEVLKSNRKVKELADKEEEIIEEEGKKLTGLAASFQNLRRQFGAFAGLVSAKEFLEGDTGSGLENAGIAVTAFLPEIIKVVSTVVMARFLLGGRGGLSTVASGGGRGNLLSQLLVGGGLLTTGAILGSRGDSDQRRFELQKRQILPNLLTKNDVGRFRATTTRFDTILDGTQRPVITQQVEASRESDIEMPDGPKDLVNNFLNRTEDKGDELVLESNVEGGEVTEELDTDTANIFDFNPKEVTSLFQESDMMFTNDESFLSNISGLNLFDISGEEDENIDQNSTVFSPGTSPGSSFITVNPEYENIVKIPFILQYGTYTE
jgi:hypothetical protein